MDELDAKMARWNYDRTLSVYYGTMNTADKMQVVTGRQPTIRKGHHDQLIGNLAKRWIDR